MDKIKISQEEFAKHRDKTAIKEYCPFRDDEKLEKGCYCGHTDMCECSNPDSLTMKGTRREILVANIPTLKPNDI